jgi:hypothetical protein
MDFGASWWRLIGSFLLVAGMLVLTLKLLTRWQVGRAPGEFKLLEVSPLGPKRSVERLRYRDEELVIYRSEGAMLLVDRQPAPPEDPTGEGPAPANLSDLMKKLTGRG